MPEKFIPYCQLRKAGYNRPISRAHVNEIKRDYYEPLADAAKVSYRDGGYYIVDHQHLAQAQYEMNDKDPNTLIKCQVFNGLTYQEEADLYYRYNTSSKTPTFREKLIGLIEAGDANAVRFRETVEKSGWVIGSNALSAVKEAWKIFNTAEGEQRLTEILVTANKCWPGEPSGISSQMLRGFAVFFRNHPDYKKDRLIKALSQYQPSELMRKASSYYKQMDSRSFTLPYCTYSIIVNAYNKGLRGSGKLVPANPVL